jgi:hypothetical protein
MPLDGTHLPFSNLLNRTRVPAVGSLLSRLMLMMIMVARICTVDRRATKAPTAESESDIVMLEYYSTQNRNSS